MKIRVTRQEETSFLLLLNGHETRYPATKEGKRQAILDGLAAVETVAAGEDVYLPDDDALGVIAAVMFPDGIKTEADYRLVCELTDKACAHIGYGEAVELGPPLVPFADRGSYRKRYPPVPKQLILDELDRAGVSSLAPQREVKPARLEDTAAWTIHNSSLAGLTPGQRERIAAQVEAIVAEAGWTADEENDLYVSPLAADMEEARERFRRYLERANGEPLPRRTAVNQIQRGAYGRSFYEETLPPELQALLEEVLRAGDYQTTPENEGYRPVPVTIPEAEIPTLEAQLAALEPVTTSFGPGLLMERVVTIAKSLAGAETLSEWQRERLIREGAVAQTLRRLGYRTTLAWCQAYQFQPRLGDDRAHQVILKEVRVENDPKRKLSLASGLGVYTPVLAIDDETDTLVYLEMVGEKGAVKANWAALAGGGKTHWIKGQRIALGGMKAHVKLQTSLPCGWVDQILIHKQASLKEMSPQEPFYLLDDGTKPIPPLFYPMLNKCLAVPILEEWADYLWGQGRARPLIALLDGGKGQGYAAWRVLPAPDAWQEVVQEGIAAGEIAF